MVSHLHVQTARNIVLVAFANITIFCAYSMTEVWSYEICKFQKNQPGT